jgi:hypothetical protein
VTVAGYPGTHGAQFAQTAMAQAAQQPASISLNTFPDLTRITNVEALLSLGESVAAQVRELIPSESNVQEAQ